MRTETERNNALLQTQKREGRGLWAAGFKLLGGLAGKDSYLVQFCPLMFRK